MGESIVNKRILIHVFLVFLLVGFFIGSVNARGGNLIVAPSNEVTEKVQLGVTDRVFGNVSATNGFIDFFVTNPSDNMLFYCNKTAFESFNFTANENGTYIMHIVNNYQPEKVNVTLSYALDITIVLTASVTLSATMSASIVSITANPSNPLDWIELLENILKYVAGALGLGKVASAFARFLEWLRWKIKYRKPRTPSEIKNFKET